MLKFFKGCWKGLNFIRSLILNLVFLSVFISLISLFYKFSSSDKPQLSQKSALYLNLDGYLTDNRAEESNFRKILRETLEDNDTKQYSIFDVVYAIRKAQKDPNITGLVINLTDFLNADIPSINYVGKAITEFKKSNKPVIAYADNYSQKSYLLASYADEIYLNPMGVVNIKGFSLEGLYFKNLLDKLYITPNVFRVGEYKSAVEPFIRNDMSQLARQNAEKWITTAWNNYVKTVANNRQISVEQVSPPFKVYLENLKKLNGDETQDILNRKLITNLANKITIQEVLAKKFGKTNEKLNLVNLNEFLSFYPDGMKTEIQNKIAVVNVEGEIIDGDSKEGKVGSKTIVQLLQQVYDNENIKGLILRVNSPGGSAFASELIRQTLMQIKAKGKPIVVSMGGVTASGGYWISAGADYIVASPNTLTGSIGIFGIIPTFEKSLAKIGVNGDGIYTTELAKGSMVTGLPENIKQVIQLNINHGYDKFLNIVSQGRRLNKDYVNSLAQGQVWIGSDALNYKLVDELGDFDTAYQKAKSLVEAKDPKAKEIGLEWLVKTNKNVFKNIFDNLNKSTQLYLINSIFKIFNLYVDQSYTQKIIENSIFKNKKTNIYLYCLGCGNFSE